MQSQRHHFLRGNNASCKLTDFTGSLRDPQSPMADGSSGEHRRVEVEELTNMSGKGDVRQI